ncbi:MAG: bacillithiol biosynthesis deacetylase BshB1 [Crocinitomicaceae bacterium]
MKLDILAFAAHPDDAELSAAGTLIKAKKAGKKIGIVDLTQGELGSRGTAETREQEAKDATAIMQADVRVNLGMWDGYFEDNRENISLIIQQIRKYKPEVILANAVSDRHPDHGRAAKLVQKACFLSGLIKIKTLWDAENQAPWRPKAVYHYIQDYYIKPDVVIDITDEVEEKLAAIKAYKTQFYDPKSVAPVTPISGEEFFDFLKGRWSDFGRYIGAKYGEGFTVSRPVGVEQITDLL